MSKPKFDPEHNQNSRRRLIAINAWITKRHADKRHPWETSFATAAAAAASPGDACRSPLYIRFHRPFGAHRHWFDYYANFRHESFPQPAAAMRLQSQAKYVILERHALYGNTSHGIPLVESPATICSDGFFLESCLGCKTRLTEIGKSFSMMTLQCTWFDWAKLNSEFHPAVSAVIIHFRVVTTSGLEWISMSSSL